MTAYAIARTSSYWWRKHRRTWLAGVVTEAVGPLLYLLALGVLLGRAVDHGGGAEPAGGYLRFVAPGLLAATAMQVAAAEGLFPVTTALKWDGAYDGMAAGPLSPGDVFTGHFGYVLLRVAEATALFLAVAVPLGGVPPRWAPLLLPAAVLTGAAFAAPLMAYAMARGEESTFTAVNRFAVVPLFLASGVFFAVDRFPTPLAALAWLSPLSHGTSLCRLLADGSLGARAAGHAAVLCAVTAVGIGLARAAYRRRLSA